MAPRANWKGYLAIAALTCPVALYTAASTAERIAFHTLNRKTGNRVHRQFVDVVTREPVPPEAQIKGYEIHPDEYVAITPDEIAASLPEHDKTLSVESFVPCDAIDESYFDRPYYLAPQDQVAVQAFAVVRDAMREAGVAALARATLFRRVRHLLIYPQNAGLIARSLHFNYEIRAESEAFGDLPDLKFDREMLDLAEHIIETKSGTFDPSAYEDRYEAALAELIRLKAAGKPLPARPPQPTEVVDLREALRRSAGIAERKPRQPSKAKRPAAGKKRSAAAASPRRKAG